MNYSKQRELILDTLKENVVHPSAEFLYEKVKEKDSSISLATLYRNLKQLSNKGIIKKIDGLESSSHFDHNTHAHYHFMCKKCNKIFDIDCNVAPDLTKKVELQTDFEITGHDIIFSGICSKCKGEN